ncbi:glucuronate isomerase [candidate division KSB1 bacterium]
MDSKTKTQSPPLKNREIVERTVKRLMAEVSIVDVHTHLYSPVFGDLLLWGIDELLTYHYLVAELFRAHDISTDRFWSMNRREQADLIWKTLFIDNSPVSEATRGVVTTLQELGLDVKGRDLDSLRTFFRSTDAAAQIERVMELAGVSQMVMTNDPFDNDERAVWQANPDIEPRFRPALRLDGLLNDWPGAAAALSNWGYRVSLDFSGETEAEVRRFLEDWIERMKPVYMAASLGPDLAYPDSTIRTRLIDSCILPEGREWNLPFGLMIGVKKAVNPEIKLAGDGVGKADLQAVENLVRNNPENRFLVTMLSRENQHELCVLARKFSNLLIFGCWWFLNNPSIITEITRERLELLGTAFIPQHSDARILEQVIYKWKHSRMILGEVLAEKYGDLYDSGWGLTEAEINRDLENLFSENFGRFIR